MNNEEKILDILQEIKNEVSEFKNEMYEFKNEMYEFKNEMYEFKNEMYEFKDEMYEFKDEMYEFKDEMYEFKHETNKRLDAIEKNDNGVILAAIREGQEMLSAKIDALMVSTASTKSVETLRDDVAQGLHEALAKIEKTA